MERVWVNGVAWDLPDGASRLSPRLKNVRRLVAVTTHGSSKLVNAVQGEAGKRTLTRSLRVDVPSARPDHGGSPCTASTRRPSGDRARFLATVDRKLARIADA